MRNVSKYDALKIKAVFLYVLNRLGKVNMMSALKIIYYANKEHLATYGRPIINDDFIAMKNGPVPSFLKDAINCAKGIGHFQRPNVDVLKGSFGTAWLYTLKPNEDPDLDELSKSDIDCLNNSIIENGEMSARDLSAKSHSDKAWQDAQGNHRMDVLQMAKDSGASDEMVKFISHHEEFARICN